MNTNEAECMDDGSGILCTSSGTTRDRIHAGSTEPDGWGGGDPDRAEDTHAKQRLSKRWEV